MCSDSAGHPTESTSFRRTHSTTTARQPTSSSGPVGRRAWTSSATGRPSRWSPSALTFIGGKARRTTAASPSAVATAPSPCGSPTSSARWWLCTTSLPTPSWTSRGGETGTSSWLAPPMGPWRTLPSLRRSSG